MNDNTFNNTYCGFVSILGFSNVGKSTLINRIIGEKVAITSYKPNTTLRYMIGVDTHKNYQAIYLDTPGFHINKEYDTNNIFNIHNTHLILFLVDINTVVNKTITLLNKLRKYNHPIILCINKIDKINRRSNIIKKTLYLSKNIFVTDIIPISAKYNKNIDLIRHYTYKYLPKGLHLFSNTYKTNLSKKMMMEEIIREKIMRFTGKELPYVSSTKIEDVYKDLNTNIFIITAYIIVNTDKQKKILIGKNGKKIKTISKQARIDLEDLLNNKIFLDIQIKTK